MINKFAISVLLALFSLIGVAEADLIDVVKSTGRIKCTYQDKERGGLYGYRGTAWVVGENDTHYLFLTSGHLLSLGRTNKNLTYKYAKINFFYPRQTAHFDIELVKYVHKGQRTTDLALFKLKKTPQTLKLGLKLIKLGNPKNLKVGARIITIGCPRGEHPSMIFGRITKVKGDFIVIQPNIIPGRSGSAVVDEKGDFVYGVVQLTDGSAVSVSLIKEFLTNALPPKVQETKAK